MAASPFYALIDRLRSLARIWSPPMTASIDLSPYGSPPPDRLARAVLAVTRRLPANWFGLRTSMPLRRIVIDWLGDRPVDTTLWNGRVRLYTSPNSCEK